MKTWIFRILVNRAKTTGTRQARIVPMSCLPEIERCEDGTCEQTIEDRLALAADAGAALDAIALLPVDRPRRDHAARRPLMGAPRGVRADGHQRGQPSACCSTGPAVACAAPCGASSPPRWWADHVRVPMRTATLMAATSRRSTAGTQSRRGRRQPERPAPAVQDRTDDRSGPATGDELERPGDAAYRVVTQPGTGDLAMTMTVDELIR